MSIAADLVSLGVLVGHSVVPHPGFSHAPRPSSGHGLGNKYLFGFGGWKKAARKDHGAALNQKHPVFAGLKEIRDATPIGGHHQVAQIIDERLRGQAKRERLLVCLTSLSKSLPH
ncbi:MULTISPECIES: hypothetical protein [unclassified Luteibacter]|uniref:hypothetical protein n=1 Tax=Luteibacter sp. PvP019 TaxID=3156436 RepID=UPI003395B7B6